jgi:hypothetical protein
MGTRSDLPQDSRGSDPCLGGSASCWTGLTRGELESFMAIVRAKQSLTLETAG